MFKNKGNYFLTPHPRKKIPFPGTTEAAFWRRSGSCGGGVLGNNYQNKAFTLIEMMLSVGVLSLLAGLSLPVYQSFQNRNELDVTTQSLVGALRRAQTYTRGVSGDSQWGVSVQSNTITLFKGASYATRDATYDELTTIAASTSTSGLTEIMFTKLAGLPATTGSITLTSINNDSRTVTINAKGMVSY